MGVLSLTVSESLGDFLQKWGIPTIPQPRINTANIQAFNLKIGIHVCYQRYL